MNINKLSVHQTLKDLLLYAFITPRNPTPTGVSDWLSRTTRPTRGTRPSTICEKLICKWRKGPSESTRVTKRQERDQWPCPYFQVTRSNFVTYEFVSIKMNNLLRLELGSSEKQNRQKGRRTWSDYICSHICKVPRGPCCHLQISL